MAYAASAQLFADRSWTRSLDTSNMMRSVFPSDLVASVHLSSVDRARILLKYVYILVGPQSTNGSKVWLLYFELRVDDMDRNPAVSHKYSLSARQRLDATKWSECMHDENEIAHLNLSMAKMHIDLMITCIMRLALSM